MNAGYEASTHEAKRDWREQPYLGLLQEQSEPFFDQVRDSGDFLTKHGENLCSLHTQTHTSNNRNKQAKGTGGYISRVMGGLWAMERRIADGNSELERSSLEAKHQTKGRDCTSAGPECELMTEEMRAREVPSP